MRIQLPYSNTYDHLRVIGCLCYAANIRRHKDKFNNREIVFPFRQTETPTIIQSSPIYSSFETHDVEETEHVNPNTPLLAELNISKTTTNTSFVSNVIPNDPTPSTSSSVPLRKSTRNSTRHAWLHDFVTFKATGSTTSTPHYPLFVSSEFKNIPQLHIAFLANVFANSEPTSYAQAIKDLGWVRAMEAELTALERNQTWTITSLPTGHKPITFKWVFKTKYKPDGHVERLKARLVVRGFNQKEGLDYKHTFSPVAKLATVRVLIAIATAKQWPLHQLDINNAFLHGYIDKEIYMLPPEGYTKASPGQVCKLSRSLYGLKQASRQWNHELTRFLISLGYIQSKHDYSLFVKTKGEEFTAALVYVDDMLITENSTVEVKALKQSLDQKFTIKDLGLAEYFLGIELCRTCMHLNKRKYILDLLTDAGLTTAKPCSFPLPTQLKLSLDKGTTLSDAGAYRRLVGRLLYLTMTRLDTSYVVQHLSQFVSAPKDVHMQAAIHLLKYLKVFRKTKKQATVSRSSTEAEDTSMAATTCGDFARGTINLGGLEVFKAKYFKKIWDTKSGGPDNLGASFYEPTYIPKGFHLLGHYSKLNTEPMLKTVLTAKDTARNPLLGAALERPIDYTLVWTSKGTTLSVGQKTVDGYIWLPVPPRGYKTVGHIVTISPIKPSLDKVMCVRSDLTDLTEVGERIWDSSNIDLYSTKPVRTKGGTSVPTGTFLALNHRFATHELACLKMDNNTAFSAHPTIEQIKIIITAFAPLVYFHPEEEYFPSSVPWFFKNGAQLFDPKPNVIMNNGDNLPRNGKLDDAFLDFPSNQPLHDMVKKGSLKDAVPADDFEYIYGRPAVYAALHDHAHYNAPNSYVYYDADKLVETRDIQILTSELKNAYPIKSSSLNFKVVGPVDKAAKSDHVFDILATPSSYEIVSLDYGDGYVIPPPWLDYTGKWGPTINTLWKEEAKIAINLLPCPPYYKIIANAIVSKLPQALFGQDGPEGPKMKPSWNGDESE
ncbi:retrovirus-related pol polyprotein from transposon TNT 1-94 [Tanacetum coccineum]